MKTNNFNSIALKIFVKVMSLLNIYSIVMALAISIACNNTHSQIVPSSCTAPVSVIDDYKVDASQIAVRKFFDQNLAYKDSIDVPDIHRDTILNALIAVYNTEIPERDSVVDIFDIHILHTSMGDVLAYIDTTYFTLNEPTLDSLITVHNLVPYYGSNPIYVYFNVDFNLNQLALINELDKVSGIHFSGRLFYANDGTDIEAVIHDDHVELIYSYPWDLCPMACQYRRFWKFKVYYDCSVEFIESYGDVYPASNVSVLEQNESESLGLFPNPATNQLNFTLNETPNSLNLEIFDSSGKKVKTKNIQNNSNEDFKGSIGISELKNGLYFCKFNNGEKVVIRKFLKQ